MPLREPSDWAYSLQSEQATLGALLLDPQGYARVRDALSAADFYTADHVAIYRAIEALGQLGQAIDLVTVAEHMERTAPEALERAGGTAYLAGLAQNTPSSLNLEHYARLVRQRALCRGIDSFAQELSRAVRSADGNQVGQLLGEARAKVASFAEAVQAGRPIAAVGALELMNDDLPALEPLIEPWLLQKSLVMIHAKRGVGKTHFALGVAFALASGGTFLQYRAPRPRDVLYVDGEMPQQLMQRRLRDHASGAGVVPEFLRIVTPDRQDKPMPDLATAAGQAEIDALIREDTALVIVDNLSCMVRSGGAENESESWTIVASWALKHRRAGRAVLFVHHSGKTGAQRGTSKREDLLDVVINLRRPPEYDDADGAVFDIYFEKSRSLSGNDIEPIRAKLEESRGGGHAWSCGPVKTATQDRIVQLWEGGGVTSLDVARELDVNKSHVHRTLERAMREGRLLRDYPQRKATK